MPCPEDDTLGECEGCKLFQIISSCTSHWCIRVYNICSPLSLWHMKRNHKLIRFPFVHGMYCIIVAFFMVSHIAQGPGRGSFITGRMERLWRDIHQIALSVFYDLLLSLEEQCYLYANNTAHLFSCIMSISRLSTKCWIIFSRSSLNHKIRTARNKTPMGVQQVSCEHGVVASGYFENLNVVSI